MLIALIYFKDHFSYRWKEKKGPTCETQEFLGQLNSDYLLIEGDLVPYGSMGCIRDV
jgi:hypothetical protein